MFIISLNYAYCPLRMLFVIVLSFVIIFFFLFFFFFFSSRRRHTRSLCDWSSDVCSSDLDFTYKIRSQKSIDRALSGLNELRHVIAHSGTFTEDEKLRFDLAIRDWRSEERRVGKECRSGWWRYY